MISKIYKHRLVIYYIVIYMIRYKIQKLVCSNRKFLQLLQKKDVYNNLSLPTFNSVQHKERFIGLSTTIINRIFPNTSCLVSCLVKKSVMKHYDIHKEIILGVKVHNGLIHAHAWLDSENQLDYHKIHKIS